MMFRNPLVDAVVVLIAVMLIFGPKRLPMLGRSLGQGIREFKDSISGKGEGDERLELTESAAGAPSSASTAAGDRAPVAERGPTPR